VDSAEKSTRDFASTWEPRDPTRLGRVILRSARALPPRICRQTAHRSAPQRGRAPAPAGVRSAAEPPDPVRPAEHRSTARSAAAAPAARTPRSFAPRAKLCGGPPAPPSFGECTPWALHSQAEWGHGVGRHARQMRGEIVSTCKTLQVRSRTRRVQTKMYPLMYPKNRGLPFIQRKYTRVFMC